jgi:hypothetical protein
MADRPAPKESITHEELALSTMLEIGALIVLLDRKDLLNKAEVLAEINSLQHNSLSEPANCLTSSNPSPSRT